MCGEEEDDMEDENAAFNPISIASDRGVHHHSVHSGRASASSHHTLSGHNNGLSSVRRDDGAGVRLGKRGERKRWGKWSRT